METTSMTKKVRKKFYLEVSKFFLDLAKLVFGGVILAGIMKEDINLAWLLLLGLIATALLVSAGYVYFKLGNKN
ncbi:MAG: ABC transporter permease [Prevotella sp.]|nr:ABC transporter permease [Prevotella sp.]